MPRRRMGRPGLVGTMARTAVVAGTATAVVGGVGRHQAGKAQAAADQQSAEQAAYESQAQVAEMQQQLDDMKAQQAAAAAPPPPAAAPAPAAPAPAAGGDDLQSQLERLSSLHTSGVLSDDEFAAAKAKVLGL